VQIDDKKEFGIERIVRNKDNKELYMQRGVDISTLGLNLHSEEK